MKKLLKHAIVASSFLFGPLLVAAQPPDIGHFKGLAFSSATDRHPLEINGGTLVGCTTDPTSHVDMTKCEVENGSLVVTGTEWNGLNVKLTHATVLRTEGTRNYYLRGTADLTIGDRQAAFDVQVTVTTEDAAPTRVRGFIDLSDQAARTSFEAYLVP